MLKALRANGKVGGAPVARVFPARLGGRAQLSVWRRRRLRKGRGKQGHNDPGEARSQRARADICSDWLIAVR